jgi:mRNA interferase MazF
VILLSTEGQWPRRGEVWWANFDPTVGSEIRKARPAVVVSSDAVGRLPLKMAAPITGWKDTFAGNLWHVRIDPAPENGLTKLSAVDALQCRGMDVQRFRERLGRLTPETMEEIALAVAAVVECPPIG